MYWRMPTAVRIKINVYAVPAGSSGGMQMRGKVRKKLNFRMISFWFMGLGMIIHFQARKEISMDCKTATLGIICEDY